MKNALILPIGIFAVSIFCNAALAEPVAFPKDRSITVGTQYYFDLTNPEMAHAMAYWHADTHALQLTESFIGMKGAKTARAQFSFNQPTSTRFKSIRVVGRMAEWRYPEALLEMEVYGISADRHPTPIGHGTFIYSTKGLPKGARIPADAPSLKGRLDIETKKNPEPVFSEGIDAFVNSVRHDVAGPKENQKGAPVNTNKTVHGGWILWLMTQPASKLYLDSYGPDAVMKSDMSVSVRYVSPLVNADSTSVSQRVIRTDTHFVVQSLLIGHEGGRLSSNRRIAYAEHRWTIPASLKRHSRL